MDNNGHVNDLALISSQLEQNQITPSHELALSLVNAARYALEDANTPTEIKNVRDWVQTLKDVFRRRGASHFDQNLLGQQVGHADFLIGDMLNAIPRANPGKVAGRSRAKDSSYPLDTNYQNALVEIGAKRTDRWIVQAMTASEMSCVQDFDAWAEAHLNEQDFNVTVYSFLSYVLKEQGEVLDIQSIVQGDARWWCGDFRDASIAPGSIDVIFTDPPYPKKYIPLYSDLARLACEWLKPGGTLAVLCGQLYLPEVFKRLTASNLHYAWTLCYLTPGGMSPQIWTENVNTFWKPVLLFSNGKHERSWMGDVARAGDVASSKVNSRDQSAADEWAQSENGMYDIARRFVQAGDLVLDPFCGSGTNALAALKLGASFYGIDEKREDIDECLKRIGGVDVTA